MGFNKPGESGCRGTLKAAVEKSMELAACSEFILTPATLATFRNRKSSIPSTILKGAKRKTFFNVPAKHERAE